MNIDICITIPEGKSLPKPFIEHLYNRFPVNQIIVTHGSTRGMGRYLAIKKVETEYFIFVDDDIYLFPWAYKLLLNKLNNNVGMIWGVTYPYQPDWVYWRYQIHAKAVGKTVFDIVKDGGTKRGATHTTLIKTSAVKDIPKELCRYHTLEDHYIRLWIEKKGYKYETTDYWTGLHLMNKTPYSGYKDIVTTFSSDINPYKPNLFKRILRTFLFIPIPEAFLHELYGLVAILKVKTCSS